MAIVFKTPKSTLNTTSKQIQNLGGDCPPCPEPVLEGKELEYTQNGEYTVTPEQGVDGFSSIDVIVNVPSDINNQNKTVNPSTSSQTVEADSGYSGLGTVTVNAVTSSIDANISAGNIKKDITILGVTGNYDPQPNFGTIAVVPSTSAQTITPPASIDGYDRINVSAVTSSIDQNIAASNIRDGVTILGVTGNYSGSTINNQNKTVSPSTSQQSVSADSGYTGLGTVTVNAVTAAIDANIVAENILDGVTILGVTGSDLGYDVGYSDGYAQGQAECPEPGGCDNTAYVQETITTNGTYTYDPSDYQGDSYDAFDGVEITVNVSSGGTNCPDWSTIGWTCNDVTASGLADDVAYTASIINTPSAWKNNNNLVFAPNSAEDGDALFQNCHNLEYVPNFVVTGTNNASYGSMFSNCTKLRRVGNISAPNRINIDYNGGSIFATCTALVSVGTIDFNHCNYLNNVFFNCSSLTTVGGLINTSQAISTMNMFASCRKLVTAPLFDTSNVTSMSGMFSNCDVLANIPQYDTSNVTDMQNMFSNTPFGNSPMTTAPSFNTSNVTSMRNMFGTNLATAVGTLVTVPLYDCSKVNDVQNMFNKQSNLTNLAGFTNLGKSFIFGGSTSNTLDLSASSVLTKQSIMNVINNLAAPDDTNVNDATLKLSAASYALLDASDIAIATAKNWSVISA